MKSLQVKAQINYNIDFIKDLHTLSDYCKTLASQVIIISDNTVADLYGEPIKSYCHANCLFTFPPGEHHKSRETKAILEDEMLSHHLTRDTLIVALGGGIVTDLAGFIAATYCRGIPVIYIPTTLLAMVDASIGGKTGVNTPHGKNLIGAFKQPNRVFVNVDFLDTLPINEFNGGMVELIKHALIADKELFYEIKNKKITLDDKDYLQTMIYKSIDIKRQIVEQDPEEKNIRQLLNFGHTIGHVIESASHYQITHGQAVALGIMGESYLSIKLGLLPEDRLASIREILSAYEMPLHLPIEFNHLDLMHYFKMDKKNVNQVVRSVLLTDIGQPYVVHGQYTHPIDDTLLLEAMRWLMVGMRS